MKKTIYYLGIASANILFVGALFKTMHWPGASILLTVAIFLFCFGFLPSSLINVYRNNDEKSAKWLYIVTFIVFAFCLVGALFKIMHWPGAGILLLVGVPLPFVLFLPVYLYHTRKATEQSLFNNLGVMFGLTFLAVFSVLLALNVSYNTLENFALNAYHNESSVKFEKQISKTFDNQNGVSNKANEICKFIEEIKIEMLNVTENQKDSETYALALNKKSASVISILFYSEEGEKSKAEILSDMVTEYREMVNKSGKANSQLKELANSLLYKSYESNNSNWIDVEFSTNQLTPLINVLTQIQSNVKFIDSEYLAMN